ncbi:MAG TPA: hypothetical protein VHD32_11750 [Candidatus Didemnitutus sp.]|nr:hypothetical protein [Candidatus Didemnitutus sp.]
MKPTDQDSSPDGAPPGGSVELPAVQRRTFYFALGAVAAWAAFFVYQWKGGNLIHLYQGLAILGLAALPALLWARRGDGGFPLMEVFMLTGVNTYAIPLLVGHEGVLVYPDEVITAAANLVLTYQAAALITYYSIRGRAKTTSFWVEEIVSERFSRFLPYGLVATTVYAAAGAFWHDQIFSHLPAETEGILRAAFFGLGIICVFILSRHWGLGQLTSQQRAFLLLNLVLQFVIEATSLLLIEGISSVVLALLGYISGSRRVPLVAVAAAITVIAILHNGKSEMRDRYWTDPPRVVTLSDVPSFYREWITCGLQRADSTRANKAAKLLDRTSLLQIICLVVDRTPSKQPFLDGDTYVNIPSQFVPRFFWPNKPPAHLSTYRLSIYYGLQTEADTASTTIGFGTLSEAYANFGFPGAVMLGVIFGFVFKKITVWTRHSPMLSYGGLILVLLLAWSFQTELTLSIWLSSLFQACVAVLGIPAVLRHLFN